MSSLPKWETVLQKFLKKWENNKDVVGALVCGSFITGNPSLHSDIDIHILLDPKITWRERWNEIIDGILVEYFANPIKKHYEYLADDYKSRTKMNAHMFCTGKILFDKTGELKKLIQDSKKYLTKKFPKRNKIQIELAKYHIWDMCDNLEEIFEAKGEEFLFVSYNFLNMLFEAYAKFLWFDSVPIHKLKRFLINEKDKKKYLIDNFPDQEFVKIFIDTIVLKDTEKMMKNFQKLTYFVLKKMGGFDIDGWKLRSPLN